MFGPDSMAWVVNGDFPAMLIGGLSSLMLQALHPLAMAGVYDHSAFREDPLGRFRRTVRFIAATTYGGTEMAEQSIAMVRTIHERISGTAPDGRPYSATDPALLTWVHTAEVYSFLRGSVVFAPREFSLEEQDEYLAEMSVIAERLGAEDVPKSVDEVMSYFADVRHELTYSYQAKEAIDVLLQIQPPTPILKPAMKLLFGVAEDQLPKWAREIMGLPRQRPAAALARRRAYQSLGALMRASLSTTAPIQASKRLGSAAANAA